MSTTRQPQLCYLENLVIMEKADISFEHSTSVVVFSRTFICERNNTAARAKGQTPTVKSNFQTSDLIHLSHRHFLTEQPIRLGLIKLQHCRDYKSPVLSLCLDNRKPQQPNL